MFVCCVWLVQELVRWLDDNNFVRALFAGHTQVRCTVLSSADVHVMR